MQLLLFSFALIGYYLLHSFLANRKVKNFLMERLVPQKYYRLLYNFISLILLLPIFYFYQRIPTSFLFENFGVKNFGFLISAVGMLLLLYALSQYNLAEFSGTQQWKNATAPTSGSLKTAGFNGIVRHPLYFSGLLIIWGGFLVRPTYLYLVMALVSTAYLYFGTKLEEKKLVEEFGVRYLNYQKKVGMLLPFKF